MGVSSLFFHFFIPVFLHFACKNVIGVAMYHPTSAAVHARAYDGFQYLEPALIPVGTYIALESIPTVFNFSNYQGSSSGFNLPALVNDIVESEIGQEEEDALEKSARRSAGIQGLQAPIKGLAGIRPLSTTRIPMGIFIPNHYINLMANSETWSIDGSVDSSATTKDPTIDLGPSTVTKDPTVDTGPVSVLPGTATSKDPTIDSGPSKKSQYNERSTRMKIFRGVRRIVARLKNVRRQSSANLRFDYNTTFSGLTPYEAVYIPHGLFVPLSFIPGRKSVRDNMPNTNSFFEGIAPLNILAMAPGIFVPHRLTSLPAMPSNVIPGPPIGSGSNTAPKDPTQDFELVSSTQTPMKNCNVTIVQNMTKAGAVGESPCTAKIPDDEMEKMFIRWIREEYNSVAETILSEHAKAVWKFETNVTNFNEAAMVTTAGALAEFTSTVGKGIRNFRHEAIKDVKFKRLYRKLSNSGDAVLPKEKLAELTKVKADMQRVYSAGAICGDTAISVADIANCPADMRWTLSPNITRNLANSRNASLLLHIWKSWRDATGKKIRPMFLRYLDLKNESARADGYPEVGLAWREPFIEPDYKYSDIDFMLEVKELWNKTLPLYIHLHAYIRQKLVAKYPDAKINPKGPIPAHLLGSSWSYNWKHLLDFTWPYPKKPLVDSTSEMIKQNWTAEKMFHVTDKFITELGLTPMPQEFWDKSMLSKPTDRPVMCQPTSLDFYNHKDFRIKMCTDVTMDDLVIIHQQMGRVEYFLQFKEQYVPFREGANTGFMEAIGDTLALSVSTPSHLKNLKLTWTPPNASEGPSRDINFLFSMALEKVAHLPFSYLMDKYRYDVFSGKIPTEQLNAKWWQAVTKNQGICAPVPRTEEDFDAGSKYHIPADVPYIPYFVAGVLQFQFHKALCKAAGHTGALYECDIDGSAAAGKLLKEVMELGSSVPWQVAMEKLTGSPRMDAGPLLEYFQTLYEWLEDENVKSGAPVGWEGTETTCPQ